MEGLKSGWRGEKKAWGVHLERETGSVLKIVSIELLSLEKDQPSRLMFAAL